MLELEDVQHYLLTRPHATIAQYNFITFRDCRRWAKMGQCINADMSEMQKRF